MKQENISNIEPSDINELEPFVVKHWGSTTIISKGVVHNALKLDGFKAIRYDELVALITYQIVGDECEIVSLNSEEENQGLGTALVEEVMSCAKEMNCKRIWLVTSNDNIAAIRYYQIKGFELVAIHRNALTEARKIKPEIPKIGQEGIELKHEVELEYFL